MINEYVYDASYKKVLWWNYYQDALKYIIELKVIYHGAPEYFHYFMLQLWYVQKNYGRSMFFSPMALYFDINHATEMEHEYNLQDEAS